MRVTKLIALVLAALLMVPTAVCAIAEESSDRVQLVFEY